MSFFELPYALDLTLEDDGVARPDGGVAIPIDGHDLLARVGTSGHLDFDSIRVLNHGATLRDTPVQFVPDADFNPLERARGVLWFRLYKNTWDDRSFPRRFRVCFDRVRDGGKKPWVRANADQPGTPLNMSAGSRAVEIRRGDVTGGKAQLAFSLPSNRKPALHPLSTPAGAAVTETMPRDHTWHRGVWFGWTHLACDDVAVPPYCGWLEPYGAVIRDLGLSCLTSGPVVQGFTSDTLWCTPDGEPLFRMSWRTEFQTVDAGWNWTDLTLTLSAARDGIVLGSEYGHLTARAAMDLHGVYMIDSICGDGERLTASNHDDIEVRWAGYSGIKTGGGPVCLVMLDHPSNLGGPPRRDYFFELRDQPIEQGSLFIAMSLNPLRGRPLRLQRGAPLNWRYRLVTSDRMLTPAFAEYHYDNWSMPWRAEWGAAAPNR